MDILGGREVLDGADFSSGPSLSRQQRIQRVKGLRRRAQFQALASTAGWMAGSAGLVLLTVGGFFSLR